MKSLGLDIGTTTVSAVYLSDGCLLGSVTKKNGYFIESPLPFEKAQNVAAIEQTAKEAVGELIDAYGTPDVIGVTGQMHGILYLDAVGNVLSPLYTWQDGRGDEILADGESYASCLSRLTGYPVATGYGCVTHFYNLKNGLVPADAAVFCTVHDYIAMRLAGISRPVTDASDAASFGVFDVKAGCFDTEALRLAGIDCALLPAVARTPVIGKTEKGVPVCVAIGDNQASFLGALDGKREGMLINIGTGSQFSAYSFDYKESAGLETRPFPGGGYLLVGASLCGGRAFAMLADFFRMTAEMLGTPSDGAYAAMDAIASLGAPEDLPTVTPLFSGTRRDPSLRGSITGLSTENFTPKHLIFAMMEGMAKELYEMYLSYLSAGGESYPLYGSGNGLRKNVPLQGIFARLFEKEIVLCHRPEEAATGAALFAESALA